MIAFVSIHQRSSPPMVPTMKHDSQFRWLLLSSSLLVISGCSCSQIPESPPGPGIVSETRHYNSGAVVPVPSANPDSPISAPAGNTYVNPTPRRPMSGTAVTGGETGLVDKPTGPMLTPRK
jgi:hypothetical protein